MFIETKQKRHLVFGGRRGTTDSSACHAEDWGSSSLHPVNLE